MIDHAIRAVVFDQPFGRLVQFMPDLQKEFQALASRGFFYQDGGLWRMSPEGLICHMLAHDINPRRAFERTAEVFNRRINPGNNRETLEKFLPSTLKLLDQLERERMIEKDPDYNRAQAWRLPR